MTRSAIKTKSGMAVSEAMLWLGFLLPPFAWIVHMQSLYLLSEYACGSNDFVPSHAVSAGLLLLSILGGLISWNNWRRVGRAWPDASTGAVSLSRFLSVMGLLASALFSVLIFAQWLPTLTGVPCGK